MFGQREMAFPKKPKPVFIQVLFEGLRSKGAGGRK